MAEELRNNFFKGGVIHVNHVPTLMDKCFGYKFIINDKRVVYSGDACDIHDFLGALVDANEFYCDIATISGVKAHMQYFEVYSTLLFYSRCNVEIYFMHIDDMDRLLEINEFSPFEISYVPFDDE